MRSDHRSRGAVSVSTAYRSIQKARVGFHTRFIFILFYCPQPGPGCTAAAYSYKTCPANTQTTRFRSGCSAINWCAAVSTAPALGEAGMASVSSTSRAVTLAVWLGTAITASTMYGL